MHANPVFQAMATASGDSSKEITEVVVEDPVAPTKFTIHFSDGGSSEHSVDMDRPEFMKHWKTACNLLRQGIAKQRISN